MKTKKYAISVKNMTKKFKIYSDKTSNPFSTFVLTSSKFFPKYSFGCL